MVITSHSIRRLYHGCGHHPKQQQQHRQTLHSSQCNQRVYTKSSHALVFAAVAVTTAAIVRDDSENNDTTTPYRYPYSSRRSMTLCRTMDPNEDSRTDTSAVTTAPSVLQREQENLPSPQLRPPSNAGFSLFSPNCLEYDHYNGVTIDLDFINDDDDDDDEHYDGSIPFPERLQHQLQIWKAEGVIRGVWIHVPPRLAAYVPTCIEQGFDFHMVTPSTTTATNDADGPLETDSENSNKTTGSKNVLILSQWLPDSTSRLPFGPTHQVGVGCLIWHPDDAPILGPQRRLLVVQEKSGPAATFRLWKLPTGLADPNEDIHDAAIRELHEETGLVGHFDGLLLVRQAHPNMVTATNATVATISTTTDKLQDDHTRYRPKKSSVQRKTSDLFFICQMTLQSSQNKKSTSTTTDIWTACPDEIAAIQWMPVQEYCQQLRWQSSPLYMELNRVILAAASTTTTTTLDSVSPHPDPATKLTAGSEVAAKRTVTPLWNDTTLPVWVDPNNNSNNNGNNATTPAALGANKQTAVSTYTNTFYSVR